jgi:arylsulfatase A-like enzyme
MKLFLSLSLALAGLCLADERPNIVVMMVDDLGFSDIGCYGSEIETPNLDALASNGLRFSQFYNTAKCHSSRVSLLTGQYCLAAGDVALSHGVTSAEVLGEAGYFTAMTGKWHLQKEPTDFGFERYFGHLSGACNYFLGDHTFRLNGEKWPVPKDDFYTTVANMDFALKFLEEARGTKKPWYLYIAFNAPHAPLHALPADYAKYKGRYTEGWDVMRNTRITKQKSLGILPASLKESPRPDHIPAWETMEKWKQDYETNRMVTLAAMIDRVDQEVGRLVADLKKNGELDRTFILFISDNGACPYDRQKPLLNIEPTNGRTSLADSTGWAWARNSPFRYYKQNQYEGGISSPAIVHWPKGLKTAKGALVHDPAHVIDVLPTLAGISKSEIPQEWKNRELRPVSGVSLKTVFDGETMASRPPIHLFFAKDRGLRDGDWKLVSYQSKRWELYDLSKDRAENHDLAAREPERLARMIARWTKMSEEVLHAPANLYSPVAAVGPPHQHGEWTKYEADSPDAYARKRKRPEQTPKKQTFLRARKNTALELKDGKLTLTFSGDDPGIAIDLRDRKLPAGPYQLRFKLISLSAESGDLFFTTNPGAILPNGKQLTFPLKKGKGEQSVILILETLGSLQQLRLDIGDGPGNATISNFEILDSNGKSVMTLSGDK